jgi:electron transfer flavoprotein beta subunit
MDIIVCMKQVPNPDLQFQIGGDGKDVKREGLTYRTNATDEFALEEAVRLKEKHKGKVTVITVGPARAVQMLREAIAKGADEAVRVAYEDEGLVDPMQVANILAAAIKDRPHDLVLTGVQSDDYLYSQTGGLLAGVLGHPHASVVTKVEANGGSVKAWRELEGGVNEVCTMHTPAVLTSQYGINVPRYAPLPSIMKAARAPIAELKPSDLGAGDWGDFTAGYTLTVRGLSPPESKGRAEMLTGSNEEVSKSMAALLRDKGFYRGA